MSEIHDNSLHKEFELERLILFSDAVFAIAITLLILEIKFPELPANLNGLNIAKLLRPTAIHFFAFMVSFFFIGQSWSRHLQLCRFLKQYNNTIIFLNLLLLFFIVIFPFSISAFVDNINTSPLIAIFFYLCNIFFVTMAQFLFAHYLIKKNTMLAIQEKEDEKQYFYLKSKYSFIMLLVTLAIMIAVTKISNGNAYDVLMSLYVLPLFSIIVTRRLKKYKPKKISSKQL